MVLVTWEEEYSVSVTSIDEQHKKLLSLVSAVHGAFGDGSRTDEQAALLRRLLVYARTHFIHEEKLMSGYGYPAFGDHKREHDELARMAADVEAAIAEGRPEAARDAVVTMKVLLTGHILGHDKRCGAFFNSKGIQ